MRSINRVVLVCGLTRDPKLSYTPSGTPVVTLRVSFTTGRSTKGEWHEKPNYIDVEVWGARAENAARYLAKGCRIAVDGRLDWSEYEGNDGRRRQAHRVVAENVHYLPVRAPAGTDAVSDGALGASGAQSGDSDGSIGERAPNGIGMNSHGELAASGDEATGYSRALTAAAVPALKMLSLDDSHGGG